MGEEVYRRLAQRLDAIPNGFPATESGVELRLLAKLFTPQEAELATRMNLSLEAPEAIAKRIGADPQQTARTLKEMARKGLIRFRRGEGTLLFALMPFVVGIYEEQLPRIDRELAELVEAYFSEVGGKIILDVAPAIHRVVAVEEAVPFDLEILAWERASALVESARAWGVRDCICRVQQKLIGKGCDHLVEVCLNLAPVEGAFDGSPSTRAISKEEALQLLHAAEEDGLVHTIGNYQDGHFYICNCCSCCCAVLRAVTEYQVPNAVTNSGFLAVVDEEECIGCGECVERCPLTALVLEETARVDEARCVGCGVCTVTCPTEAIGLQRRADAPEPPPANLKEWMARRAQARGMTV